MYLKENVWEYDQDRVGQIEDEPDLDRLDVGGAGEAGGHGDVEGGEDHHAGDAEVRDEFRNNVGPFLTWLCRPGHICCLLWCSWLL